MNRAAIGICVLGTLACIPASASATAITFTTCVSVEECEIEDGFSIVMKLVGGELEILAASPTDGNYWWKSGIAFDSSLSNVANNLVDEALASGAFPTLDGGDPVRLILITNPHSLDSLLSLWPALNQPGFPGFCTDFNSGACAPGHGGGLGGELAPISGPDVPVPVPEPSTLLLSGLGLGLTAYRNRRRIRSKV